MVEKDFKENSGESFVHQLTLKNFRNYRDLEVELGKGFTVVSGKNGQGKTNLLEALHLASTTRLLRGQRETEGILDGADSCEVSVELAPHRTLVSFQLSRGARKSVLLNRMKLPRASDILGRIACVCVSAEDMEIVRGEPAGRRMFLDLELSSRSPSYLRHFTIYKRALEQRNALLRQAREQSVGPELWEVWEEQLSEHGTALRALREEFVERIRHELPGIHEEIGGGEQADVRILCRDDSTGQSSGLQMLADSRAQDILRGSTSVGPHRDDLEFSVGLRSARLFGSQGQQRTLVIALKLATLLLGKRERGSAPLLLLDDIFSDLDGSRRTSLVRMVLSLAGQTVLTCTEPEAAGREILGEADVFTVNAGELVKQG